MQDSVAYVTQLAGPPPTVKYMLAAYLITALSLGLYIAHLVRAVSRYRRVARHRSAGV
ncbi:MAG: hypothetical protein V4617_07900 [Gemmatimonadota bacterium]